jgi:signal transduction histidine kinase
MASENFPLLFPTRLAEGLGQSCQPHLSGAKSLLSQLLQAMAATLHAPDALPKLTEVLGIQLGAQACLILRYHRDTQDIVYTCWQGESPAQIWLLPDSGSLPKLALQRRIIQALMHQNFYRSRPQQGDLHWRDGLMELLQETEHSLDWLQGMRVCKTIPVDTAPDMDGAILLLSQHAHYSTSLSETQEMDMASIVAIALHQHYLQHQAQRSTEQLRYLNYLKEDFLSTLNHELRTPLTSMMLAIRMLRRSDLTPERTAMYLDILDQQCSREINLVNDLLMLQTVDAKTVRATTAPTDLVQALKQIAEQELSRFTTAQLHLELDLPATSVVMATSSEYLARVLQELLTNACKYSAPGSVVTLSLEDNRVDRRSVRIRLTNTGEGIQSEELPHIFEKFRRGNNATRKAIPGTGTGLALVKGLVEQLGGTIAVASDPCDEVSWQNCFTIDLLT